MHQQQGSEIATLREQCSNHAKERAALKTILDAKIKALVDDIGQSVSDLPPEVSLPALCIPAYLPQLHWQYSKKVQAYLKQSLDCCGDLGLLVCIIFVCTLLCIHGT